MNHTASPLSVWTLSLTRSGRVPDFLDLLRRGLDQDKVAELFQDIFFELSGEMPCNCKAGGCKGYVFGCDEYWGALRAKKERMRQEVERRVFRMMRQLRN